MAPVDHGGETRGGGEMGMELKGMFNSQQRKTTSSTLDLIELEVPPCEAHPVLPRAGKCDSSLVAGQARRAPSCVLVVLSA